MTGTARFVASRTLAGLDVVRIDDRPVIESYERLQKLLRQRCGDAVAELFAEPVISRSNGAAPARVDWYTHREGQIRPLAELDPAGAEKVRQRLRAALAALEPILRDRESGAFAAACLNLAAPQAILAAGDAPLLVDWGLLPQGLAADESGRAHHHASILAAAAQVDLPHPPVDRADWAARFRPAAHAGPDGPPAQRPRPMPPARRGWVAAAVATATAALLLAVSYVPGVLIFPSPPQAVATESRAVQTAWLDGLRRRRDTLAAAENLACPRLRTELPGLVPQSPAGVRLPAEPGAPPQARAAVETPPPPAGSSRPGTVVSGGLVDRLERGTVLVLAGDATGSGFFVADDLVVTNRHVVEGAATLMIAGRHAGVAPATLVRLGEPGTLTDFALLRVSPRAGGQPLALATPGRPLTPVVASGFPGLYLGTDPAFARLRDGDAGASRDLEPVLQTGVVNHLQRYDAAAVTLVLHAAEIAPGNSGGPLVDYCGRVVGVNAFGRSDDRLPVTARYALGSDGLVAFLAQAGVQASLDDRPCDLQAPARPTAAAEPAEAAPQTAGPAGSPTAGPAPAAAPGPAAPRPDARPAPRTGRDARPPAR
jgi:S1-C subfamily serine protease